MMLTLFTTLSPIWQALIATCFTWLFTALGAAVVFFFKEINRKALDAMLGFAAGVMIAASFWSLLAPAIVMVEEAGGIKWLPPLIGFLSGGIFLWSVDKILPHVHPGFPANEAEGVKTSWQRSVLLVLAITLHNIPEGLAIGVAFGAVAADISSTATLGAGGTRSRCAGCGGGPPHAAAAALCPLFCGRGHDLCGGRGAHPRIPGRKALRCGHHRPHDGLCGDDDPGRGPRLTPLSFLPHLKQNYPDKR
jgi:ZIP family zinc transporter